VANDDWRVTVTVQDSGGAAAQPLALREHEVEDDVRRQLGHRVAVSEDGERIFLYAGSEDAARRADQIVRELVSERGLQASFALDRWHPVAQEWQDASVLLPRTEDERQAEHQRLEAEEARESLTSGYAEWEVRVELPSHHEANQLADRLRAEGKHVIRRWRYLIIAANTEDDAAALAAQIQREAPAGAALRTDMAGAVVPFILF
jgi:hypothetical protein